MRLVRLYDPRPIFMNSQCCVSFQCLLIRRCQGSRQLLRVEARGGPEAKRWRCSAGPSTGYLFDSDSLSILGRTHGRSWKGTCPQSSVLFVGTKSACFSKVVPLPSRAAATGPVELRLSFAFTIPQTASIMFSSLQLSRCTTVSVSLGGVKNPYTTLTPTLKKQHQGVLLGF